MGRGLPTLRDRLIALVAVVVLPLCLLVGLSAWLVQRAATEQAREALLAQARSLAAAVDAQFAQGTAVLRALAASDSVARGDLDAIEREMRGIAAALGGSLAFYGADGRFLLTTVWPPGERRRDVPPPTAEVLEARDTGRPVITNVLVPTQARTRISFGVALPVPREDGTTAWIVGYALSRERIRALVAADGLPAGVTAAVHDRALALVARTGDDEALVGLPDPAPLPDSLRAAPEGFYPEEVANREGERVVAAFARAPVSGYVATLAVPEAAFFAPLRETLWQVVPVGLLVAAGGLAAALALARRIAAAIRALAALGRGEQPAPAGLREVDDAARALTREAEDRRIAQQRQALLMGELNHRVKNVLASVQSVAVQTLRGAGGDPMRFADDFKGRLRSLAAAHDLLTERAWAGADLDAVVEAALAPWRDDPRLRLSGTDRVLLTPLQAQSLVLALHELATNACKHGAMSVAGGMVLVTHAMEDDGTATLTWTERGGPPVTARPERRGFGLRLLERGLSADLGRDAQVTLDFAPEGLAARIGFTPAG